MLSPSQTLELHRLRLNGETTQWATVPRLASVTNKERFPVLFQTKKIVYLVPSRLGRWKMGMCKIWCLLVVFSFSTSLLISGEDV